MACVCHKGAPAHEHVEMAELLFNRPATRVNLLILSRQTQGSNKKRESAFITYVSAAIHLAAAATLTDDTLVSRAM